MFLRSPCLWTVLLLVLALADPCEIRGEETTAEDVEMEGESRSLRIDYFIERSDDGDIVITCVVSNLGDRQILVEDSLSLDFRLGFVGEGRGIGGNIHAGP
ncbi:MAG: hypothetical protein DWQ31_18045 [Planctomycetota bacterium]|nr:MAG: hypothetical protein DWQ31_18045 [Planctomycetota bacterium]